MCDENKGRRRLINGNGGCCRSEGTKGLGDEAAAAALKASFQLHRINSPPLL